jgi:hypothetical protein
VFLDGAGNLVLYLKDGANRDRAVDALRSLLSSYNVPDEVRQGVAAGNVHVRRADFSFSEGRVLKFV